MASGLPHAQFNNGDVHSADADIAGAAAWYARLGVPWGMRVPLELDWPHGRWLFEKRLMGLERLVPAAPADVRVADDLEAVVAIDAAAFEGESSRDWLAPQFAAPGYETALAFLDGAPVGTGFSVLSHGRAGPCVYVAGVGVVPEARGRGIGSALVSWLIERAFARGATLAHLHPDDDGAAGLYARLGFVEVPGFNVFVNQ